jgi:hypothetical protein
MFLLKAFHLYIDGNMQSSKDLNYNKLFVVLFWQTNVLFIVLPIKHDIKQKHSAFHLFVLHYRNTIYVFVYNLSNAYWDLSLPVSVGKDDWSVKFIFHFNLVAGS